MTEDRQNILKYLGENIPKLDETRRALVLAYGEGLDAGVQIGMGLALAKIERRKEGTQ